MLRKAIRRGLDIVLSENPGLEDLFSRLARHGRPVIFGGFLRDQIHNYTHGAALSSRDLDIVVDGTIQDPPKEAEINNFGGYRYRLAHGLKIDCWELSRTYAFNLGLFKSTLNNLVLTTIYSVNACFFDISDNRLVDHHAVTTISQKKILFNCVGYLDRFPEYQAFRAIELVRRLGYELHQDILYFVQSTLRRSDPSHFAEAVRKHRPDLSEKDVLERSMPYLNASKESVV